MIGIQYLRGLAAAMVACLHLAGKLAGHNPEPVGVSPLGAGVDIFFVISGFVMAYSTRDGSSIGPGQFLIRRVVRIVPLYWTVTAVMLLAVIAAPGLARSAALSWPHVVASFLFLPFPHPSPSQHGLWFPLVIPGWTINLEMFFYLLFAVGLAAARGRPLVAPLLVTVALLLWVVFANAGPVLRPAQPWGYYANPMVLEFALGMWLAVAYRRLPRLPAVVPPVMAVSGLSLIFLASPLHLPRFAAVTAGAGLLVYGAAEFRGWRSRWAGLLGDSSYSLYLSQTFTVSAWGTVGAAMGLVARGPGQAVFLAAGLALAAAVGAACWRFVERPATALARSLTRGPALGPALVGAETAVR